MFKFLKEKLKSAVSSITKKVDEEAQEVKTVEEKAPAIEEKKVKQEAKELRTKDKSKKEKRKEIPIEAKEKKEETAEEKPKEADRNKKEKSSLTEGKYQEKAPVTEASEQPAEEKQGFFAKLKRTVTTKRLSQEQFENIFWYLEIALLESNIAVEVIEKIKEGLKNRLVNQPIKKSEIEHTIISALKSTIKEILSFKDIDFVSKIREKKPYVICFLGINGSGKTTTIAKIAYLLQKRGLVPVIAAADTFRAAAIDQLEEHAKKLGVKMIKHQYGSDAAAVAYDAIEHAKAKNKDVVLIDTAGRMHSNRDLLDELKKIIRVSNPDMKIFVGESITGNDCVEQAKRFDEAVGIDAIILTKADIDEKGGAPISISYVTKKPIIFIGTGQKYENLKKFDPEAVIKDLGLE